jgi:hypothetical protein
MGMLAGVSDIFNLLLIKFNSHIMKSLEIKHKESPRNLTHEPH